MDLNTIWFMLIAVLFIGFFFLEGFDYGVGILLPFLGKDDRDRRLIINTIGPHWDGNEVWLLTAGGAMFAAFPHWYATMFSGFYLALALMLLALIVRGVAFEFRSKHDDPRWRSLWDWAIFFGSALPALLWGVALTNILKGVPVGSDMSYQGNFWSLIHPYTVLGGLMSLGGFTFHGALFLSLKTDGELLERACRAARILWLPVTILVFLTVGIGYFVTDMFARLGINPGAVPLGAGVAVLLTGWLIRRKRDGWAFAVNGIAILLSVATVFIGLYPRVLVSSLNPEWSLTIYTASSSPLTLRTMAVVAAIFVPIVLIYQGWTYYVFRQRLTHETRLEY
jgi:cytochrome d ubiquinol oxidase subunit II